MTTVDTTDRGASLHHEAVMHAEIARWARRIMARADDPEDYTQARTVAEYHEARVRALAAACEVLPCC